MADRDRKMALFLAKLNQKLQENRIDSPLVRYNEFNKPVCRVCEIVLNSDSDWIAHQASRKHHEANNNLKASVSSINVVNTTNSETIKETPKQQGDLSSKLKDDNSRNSLDVQKARTSSVLPADFFDHGDTKQQKVVVDKTTEAHKQVEQSPTGCFVPIVSPSVPKAYNVLRALRDVAHKQVSEKTPTKETLQKEQAVSAPVMGSEVPIASIEEAEEVTRKISKEVYTSPSTYLRTRSSKSEDQGVNTELGSGTNQEEIENPNIQDSQPKVVAERELEIVNEGATHQHTNNQYCCKDAYAVNKLLDILAHHGIIPTRAEIEDLKSKALQYDDLKKHFEYQISHLETSNSELQGKTSVLTKENSSLKFEVENFQSELSKVQGELSKVQKDSEEKLGSTNNQIIRLQRQINEVPRLHSEVKNLQLGLSDAKKEKEILQRKHAKVTDECIKLMQRAQSLAEKEKSMMAELEKIKDQKDFAESMKSSLENQVLNLESSVNELESQNKSLQDQAYVCLQEAKEASEVQFMLAFYHAYPNLDWRKIEAEMGKHETHPEVINVLAERMKKTAKGSSQNI